MESGGVDGKKWAEEKPAAKTPGDAAAEYLDLVKKELSSRPLDYKEFLRILVLFRKNKIHASDVIKHVYKLFGGNHQLVLKFQFFLPRGCTIHLARDENGDTVPTVLFEDIPESEKTKGDTDVSSNQEQLDDRKIAAINETKKSPPIASDVNPMEGSSSKPDSAPTAAKGNVATMQGGILVESGTAPREHLVLDGASPKYTVEALKTGEQGGAGSQKEQSDDREIAAVNESMSAPPRSSDANPMEGSSSKPDSAPTAASGNVVTMQGGLLVESSTVPPEHLVLDSASPKYTVEPLKTDEHRGVGSMQEQSDDRKIAAVNESMSAPPGASDGNPISKPDTAPTAASGNVATMQGGLLVESGTAPREHLVLDGASPKYTVEALKTGEQGGAGSQKEQSDDREIAAVNESMSAPPGSSDGKPMEGIRVRPDSAPTAASGNVVTTQGGLLVESATVPPEHLVLDSASPKITEKALNVGHDVSDPSSSEDDNIPLILLKNKEVTRKTSSTAPTASRLDKRKEPLGARNPSRPKVLPYTRGVPSNSLEHLTHSVSEDSRRRHKTMLLKLFSRYSKPELDSLEKETGVPLQALDPPSPKERRKRALLVSRIAPAMGDLSPPNTYDSKKPDFVSRNLDAVKEETESWHQSHNAHAGNISSFALKFNECSLAVVSKWAACFDSKNKAHRLPPDPSNYHRVHPGFRMCLSCQSWGHFERECCNTGIKSITARSLTTKRPRIGTFQMSGSDNKKLVVEKMEGHPIEQRASAAQPMWSKGTVSASNVPVTTMEIDGSFITAITSPFE